MAVDAESLDLLVATVQRFVQERPCPPTMRWKKPTRCRPLSSKT